MITVLTPAASTRLTTVSVVRARLSIPEGAADDTVVGVMIDAASQMAVNFCNRGFGKETVKQVEHLTRPRQDVLLDRGPAVITAIVADEQELGEADYHFDPARNVVTRINGSCPVFWSGRVEITYAAGWNLPDQPDADLPAVVEHAVLLLIAATWSMQQRDPLVKSETVEGIGRTDFYVSGSSDRLPDPMAGALLQPYRKLF